MRETIAPVRTHTPVLMYHSIAARSSPAFRRYCVDPDLFEEHLGAIVAGGYRSLTVSEFVAARTRRRPVPDRCVVLTFDDAFDDFHSRALDSLIRHGLTATLYVPTAYVGGTSRWLAAEREADRAIVGWSALTEIAAAGIEIGSHSQTHPQLDLLSPSLLRGEVCDSRHLLQDRLQLDVASFAYPFGYHSARVREVVTDAGYRSACVVRDLSSPADENAYAISRRTVPYATSIEQLLRWLAIPTGRAEAMKSRVRAEASRTLRRAQLVRR